MGIVTREKILETLAAVPSVTPGMITGVQVGDDGHVVFMIEVDPARGSAMEPLRQTAEDAVAKLPGVKKVSAILTAERAAQDNGPDPHGMNKNPPLQLPIKTIIAVASGKGGVGKSTVAFNIAVALARAGQSVGLLDADIYGPSVPRLSGIGARKPVQNEDNKVVPLEAHGLKVMSIGFLIEEEKALIWRGPMVQTALYQMLRDVAWGTQDAPLDVLIIDMPPGTGDAQLTLAQKVPVTGAVIVSTPQDLALIDARKAIAMFETTGVPVLGIVENMSMYVCPSCGHEDHVFGHGGAQDEARVRGVPFLGAIPLTLRMRAQADAGEPSDDPVFERIAAQLSGAPA